MRMKTRLRIMTIMQVIKIEMRIRMNLRMINNKDNKK